MTQEVEEAEGAAEVVGCAAVVGVEAEAEDFSSGADSWKHFRSYTGMSTQITESRSRSGLPQTFTFAYQAWAVVRSLRTRNAAIVRSVILVPRWMSFRIVISGSTSSSRLSRAKVKAFISILESFNLT